ncbi:SMP-30/gluconolactonase/LRE family protein [Nocardioides sp. SYSU DS0651]|uniref:SMP-30/gluconolactonase/LRE family protein n=1 Tax=Nocardioides sp. SYSU DS0651 TaxID=3415955 RepID=UPI003F4B4E4B
MSRAALRRTTLLGVVAALLATVGLLPAAAAERPVWHTRVFANVPKPGFPAYVHVHPNGRVYAATYTNPTGDAMRSRVFEWTASGTLLRSWTVPGQDLAAPRGVQVATSDARGRLVLLEKSRGRVLTLDVTTGRFRVQATIPDLPGGGHPIPNYATWGPDGGLYVSDYGQDVIWRIPAAGGTPRAWFRSLALAGLQFGTTGLVYEPDRRAFLISQQTTTDPLDLLRGHLYRLPVRADGSPGALRTLWTSGPLDLPDGFGISAAGNIYVALLGTNQVVKLGPDGAVRDRFPKAPLVGSNGSAVPFDSPSNATFLGTRLLVANQSAIVGNASHHVILDVEVGEPGAAPFIPARSRLR